MFTAIWIVVIVTLIFVGAIKSKAVGMQVEWRPILFGMTWIEIVWLIIFAFSVINILLFITHAGRDAFALMSAKVSGDIGVRVGLGGFLLLLSGSQVFHFYEKTVNVLAHAFLMLATTGIIGMPSIDASNTIAALEAQIVDMRGAIAAQRPASMLVQRASMRPASSTALADPANGGGADARYEVGESLFFNPYLGRNLNAGEIAWCKGVAGKGSISHKTAVSCGYVKPSTAWCNANTSIAQAVQSCK